MLLLVLVLNCFVAPVAGFSLGKAFKAAHRHSIRRDVALGAVNDDSELSRGAPSTRPPNGWYESKGGIFVDFSVEGIEDAGQEVQQLIDSLDQQKGVLLTSSYEVPERYSRWTVGFTAPMLQIDGTGMHFSVLPLNPRGEAVAQIVLARLQQQPELFLLQTDGAEAGFTGSVIPAPADVYFAEEDRSRQPSLFSLVRAVRSIFEGETAGQLGLYGALGYDLTFQFEPVPPKKERGEGQRDLVMFLPDEVLVVDNQKNDAWRVKYEFTDSASGRSTKGLAKTAAQAPYQPAASDAPFQKRDSEKGAYAESVVRAKQEFRVGNLFEVVLSQIFRERMTVAPSAVFRRLCARNPSPYGFFMNLGRNEFLVGASPEMFVRVEMTRRGLRIETCPISGTIERGSDALEDAQQIMKLLSSAKEESELTMCTDVDRNDKSRICVPGSVKVIGRRQIELYSRLIHTVDHVEGYLRSGFDALDAFLCHTWAVTVTGAPKTWAMRFIEEMEPSVRHWYGGAVGFVGFDGSLNTGLTLRTVRIKDGIAEVRAGATLLHDSDPAAEEAETELKASALLDAITRSGADELSPSAAKAEAPPAAATASAASAVAPHRVLLVDHEDSFVHTLANYLRQTGAEVVTCRSGAPLQDFMAKQVDKGLFRPDLVVLSPGPGSPTDFQLSATISSMIERRIPLFGVCLGLQGLVEHFGGSLGVLDYPMHGKPSPVSRLFADSADAQLELDVLRDLPPQFQVARYHSLYGQTVDFPAQLLATAVTEDGVVMALQHRSMPIAAVQFHPESILTLPKHGMQIIANALEQLTSDKYAAAEQETTYTV